MSETLIQRPTQTKVKVNPFTQKTALKLVEDKKVPTQVLLNFVNNFKDETAAGQTPQQIIKNNAETTENKYFKAILGNIYERVQTGQKLHEAMNKYPTCLPLFLRSLFYIGQKTGNWTGTQTEKGYKRGMLELIIEQLERENKIKSKLTSAMVYPCVILAFVALALIIITYFVLPQLKDFFIGMNFNLEKLNFATRSLLFMGDFIEHYYWSIPLAIIAFGLGCVAFWRSVGKELWQEKQLDVYGLGNTIKKLVLAEVFSLLSILLEAGIPAHEALEIMAKSCTNKPIGRAITQVSDKALHGKGFSESFKDAHKLFEGEPFNILSSAERSGTLDTRPRLYGESLIRKADEEIDRFISVFPYVLLGMVAAVVGFIVIGFYSSFFSIFQITQ